MRLKDIVDNPIPVVNGGITIIIFGGHMQNKLCAYFTKTDSLYFIRLNSTFDITAFKIVDSLISDEQSSFLLFLVVVELEDGAAQVDRLCVLINNYIRFLAIW